LSIFEEKYNIYNKNHNITSKMAETLLSPGVLARENDQSFLTQQPVEVGAAIIGPAVLGPVNIPTLVTSYSDYTTKFGNTLLSGSQEYSYLTSIAAFNYFQNGGNTLLVTRVVPSASLWTSATASAGTFISNGAILPLNNTGSTAVNFTASFTMKTIAEGNVMNNYISGSNNFFGETGSDGTLISGSGDNIRFQITSVDPTNGIFSLLIRQGNDTVNEPSVLETFTNLSLDPTQPNYISKVIGDSYKQIKTVGSDTFVEYVGNYPNNSRYVYIDEVNNPTPFYFNNAGTVGTNPLNGLSWSASLPVACNGAFGGAGGDLFYSNMGAARFYDEIQSSGNIQGLDADDYDTAIGLMGNQDEYVYNVISVPGLTKDNATSQISSIINTVQTRGDAVAVIDLVSYGSSTSQTLTAATTYNSSYAAAYWPWLQTIDPGTGQLVWIPASTLIPGVYAFNDSVSDPWFAPAGINRGGLDTVVRAEQKLTQTQRNDLYVGNINPIATFPGTGVVVYGQKTLQKKASALDRVNVRRLLIALKSYISQIALNLVFEQNTIATRNQFLSQVNPYLESVQQRQGLFAFRVIMDDSNNTPDVIDRNQLIGQIYLQPTKTAEFIYLDFNILPTGATFPA
jgi:phage tail sheath protein FI